MRVLHGMLESDPIRGEEEFKKVFICLTSECGISWNILQAHLGKPAWIMQGWTRGENLPAQEAWIEMRFRIMRALEHELEPN